jgi:hypothetical protein
MKIRKVGAKPRHADRQTDRLDETSSRFSQFYEGAQGFPFTALYKIMYVMLP